MKARTLALGRKPKWPITMPTKSIQVEPMVIPLKLSFARQSPAVMTMAKSSIEYAVPLTIRN